MWKKENQRERHFERKLRTKNTQIKKRKFEIRKNDINDIDDNNNKK